MRMGHSGNLSRCDLTRTGACLAIAGEIDEDSASPLVERAAAAIGGGVTRLDLSGVTFFSAAGVRVLVLLGGSAEAEHVVVRVTCSMIVWRILELCGIRQVTGLLLEPPTRRADPAARPGR
ncbi:STAS domain-containing protein [Cryptosporangium minutisporangium]|uniref:STAS domain-containing protein n=1 Tax=Cryptosporangium minutisporangium TaxID=113569 RepID=A0ABP6T531_9ACTN